MLERLRPLIMAGCVTLAAPFPSFCLFFSWSDGSSRARVVHAVGRDFDRVWSDGCARIVSVVRGRTGGWLRIDWVDVAEQVRASDLQAILAGTKRNYFRYGIAFDTGFDHALMEQELNANAVLYPGNAIAYAQLNSGNLSIYAQQRFGTDIGWPAETDMVVVFSTAGLFCDGETVHRLHGAGRDAGRRIVDRLDDDLVRTLVRSGSDFLARQVGDDGRFVYGYHPCFDRQIAAYNALRHASTTYAMVEAFEVTGDPMLGEAVERALGHLTERLIRHAALADGQQAAFLVDVGDEVKLGGNAVAILALVKHCEVTGERRHLALMEQLAVGISLMQAPSGGGFVHVLDFPSLRMKEMFRTIYYDGEAAFGLIRLYGLTGDPRWLHMVERAFDHFIAQEHWRHHDHWLGYCVNELTRYRPQERYFRFGLQNVAGHLDFVIDRITTFPTLLEMMTAAREMLSRMAAIPECLHLFAEIDLEKFDTALEARARHLLNGYFWPEIAMYFRNPARICGSFFIRHQAFRVRIDDVEHYLSGFVAYLRHLTDKKAFDALVKQLSPKAPCAALWTAETVAQATGGRWREMPPEGWTASGLCIHAPTMLPGQMVVVRSGEGTKGMAAVSLPKLTTVPAAILTGDPAQRFDAAIARGVPVLDVADSGNAILALAESARERMTARVLAVTGSAGKTTAVAMLGHVLDAYGKTGTTAHNANLPHGVAWNLASMPPDAAHVVLELAIGRMATSARLVRPHVGLFTNVLPAHLGEKSTLADIATTKSAIFTGMRPGDVAVINRDMAQWHIVHSAAQACGLRIVHYGTGADCDVQLIDYVPAGNQVTARLGERQVAFEIGAAGRHMAENALGVLAAVMALGYDPEPAMRRLAGFRALPGRGEATLLQLDERRIEVIDDAYNANPGSMRAGLQRLADGADARRRVAVLSEMADLGPQAAGYHAALAPLLETLAIDRIYLIGPLYADLWRSVDAARRGAYVATVDELKEVLMRDLRDGDLLLLKGSHATQLHRLVDWLRQAGSALA